MGKEGNALTVQQVKVLHAAIIFKYASASLDDYHGLSTAKHIQQRKITQQYQELNIMEWQTQYVDYVPPTTIKITGTP